MHCSGLNASTPTSASWPNNSQAGRLICLYASLIIHATRKFKGDGWLNYDKNFRKYAEAHPGIRWTEANTSLWTMAFCTAQPRPHCDECFSIDHTMQECDEYSPPEEPESNLRFHHSLSSFYQERPNLHKLEQTVMHIIDLLVSAHMPGVPPAPQGEGLPSSQWSTGLGTRNRE